jgi:hypothetical protein
MKNWAFNNSGQSYDGQADMAGVYFGVFAEALEKCSYAKYIYRASATLI